MDPFFCSSFALPRPCWPVRIRCRTGSNSGPFAESGPRVVFFPVQLGLVLAGLGRGGSAGDGKVGQNDDSFLKQVLNFTGTVRLLYNDNVSRITREGRSVVDWQV